jgi:hypothetical protein
MSACTAQVFRASVFPFPPVLKNQRVEPGVVGRRHTKTWGPHMAERKISDEVTLASSRKQPALHPSAEPLWLVIVVLAVEQKWFKVGGTPDWLKL